MTINEFKQAYTQINPNWNLYTADADAERTEFCFIFLFFFVFFIIIHRDFHDVRF
jgi:hypothetical protein